MKKIFIAMLMSIIVLFGAVGFAQQEKEFMPIEPKKSDELEKALKNIEYKCDPYIKPEQAQIKIYDQIKPYSDKMNKKIFIAAIAAALGSDDADIRYNAAGYLLSPQSIADKRIIIFVQNTLQKLMEYKEEFQDTHGFNEMWWLVRLMEKYPDIKSIPILLEFAKTDADREFRNVVTTDGRTLDIRNPISFFPDVAAALRVCSNEKIGDIPERGNWRFAEKDKETLVEKWKLWWQENKDRILKKSAKEKTARAIDKEKLWARAYASLYHVTKLKNKGSVKYILRFLDLEDYDFIIEKMQRFMHSGWHRNPIVRKRVCELALNSKSLKLRETITSYMIETMHTDWGREVYEMLFDLLLDKNGSISNYASSAIYGGISHYGSVSEWKAWNEGCNQIWRDKGEEQSHKYVVMFWIEWWKRNRIFIPRQIESYKEKDQDEFDVARMACKILNIEADKWAGIKKKERERLLCERLSVPINEWRKMKSEKRYFAIYDVYDKVRAIEISEIDVEIKRRMSEDK